MRTTRFVVLAALLAGFLAPAAASEKTYEGTMVCAKCTLKKPDAKDCQDVLLVETAAGQKTEYYIAKNDVAKQAGEVCTQQVKATVTGTVSEVDGKAVLTASKIRKDGEHKNH